MNWFNRLKIQGKLLLIFSGVALMAALVVGLNIYNVIRLDHMVDVLLAQDSKLDDIYNAQYDLQSLEVAEKSYLFWEEDRYQFDFDRYNSSLDSFLHRSIMAAQTENEKSVLYDFQLQKQTYARDFSDAVLAIEEGDEEELNRLWDGLEQDVEKLYRELDLIIDMNFSTIDDLDWNAYLYMVITLAAGVLALLLFIILAVLVAYVLVNQVERPLCDLIDAVKAVEEGYFTPDSLKKYTDRRDEIGRLCIVFNEMAVDIEDRQKMLYVKLENLERKIRYFTHEDSPTHE